MRKRDRELGFGLTVAFSFAVLCGLLFWAVRLADAWDTKIGRMVETVDLLMEKAYGIAVKETR